VSTHRFAIVDVFTDTPLSGNQLGVFPDGSAVDPSYYQHLAKELGFAETVFVLPAEHDGTARIRIFTPASELPFAGHPVLGTAIFVGGREGTDSVTLETGAGAIPVAIDGAEGRMTQPVPTSSAFADEPALLKALGVRESMLPVEQYALGPTPVFVTLGSPDEVAALHPDLTALARFPNAVSCIARAGNHWKARVFVPGHGVPEDPATGSAAGPMALHLARHGAIAFGEEIEIHQGEEVGRPSVLFATAFGTAQAVERVEVRGSAVVVAEGEFTLP
jgi:trans-2,3-dihydro-3-hydroxyanthranilate isomerase